MVQQHGSCMDRSAFLSFGAQRSDVSSQCSQLVDEIQSVTQLVGVRKSNHSHQNFISVRQPAKPALPGQRLLNQFMCVC